ncbi:MAG: hypothetical protein HS128_02185 [Ideonella sp.]|nr:hypothetical protein [Ideonella sp.]MCC7458550.1 hypothetical protein [Nitrospira sp.]
MKNEDTAALAAGNRRTQAVHEAGPLHIELQRCGERWQAVIQREGVTGEVTTLHQLIRWLVDLSSNPNRPSGGLQ